MSVPRLLRPIVACALASALALTVAASASAAGWLPLSPALNGSGTTVRTPKVAVDDAGNVYAAWIEGSTLEVSKRPVGGVFEAPQTLDPTPTTTTSQQPDIGVDGAGNAVVVWMEAASSGAQVIREARRAAGAASFATPVTVPATTPALQGLANPELAINRAGEAVLAVQGSFNTDGYVRAYLGTSTSNFTEASPATFHDYQVTGSPSIFRPDVAMNEAGDTAIVWRVNQGSALRIDAGYRVHGVAGFGPLENVNAGDVIGKHEPTVALDASGNAVTVWDEDASTSGKVRAYERPAGAAMPWGQLGDLDNGQSGNAFPVVAFDASGAAVAAWAARSALLDSVLPAGAGMQFAQPPQTLAASPEAPFALALDAGAAGTTALVWASSASSNSLVRAAVRPSGGAFGPIATLSPTGDGADQTDVAVDPQGNAAAVWVDFNPLDKSTRLVTNEYDGTSPSFGTVSVPSTADAGVLVAMSASASDDWSQPTIGWDFGDGQTANGNAVSHTYAKAGTYTVTATATDGGGNTAVVTRGVTVPVVVPPLAKPKIGKTFNAATVHGTILVSTPKSGTGKAALRGLPPVRGAISPPHGYTKFHRLGARAHVPIGSILQASLGTVSITMSVNKTGTKLQTGQFSQGLFLVKQTTHSPLTSAEMMGGGNFKRDCKRPSGKLAVGAARRRPHRQLFANVHGRFRTRGRHSTATVRGTQYLVKESCKGTLTIVSRGRVVVRDFRKHRTVIVRAGHRYLAAQ